MALKRASFLKTTEPSVSSFQSLVGSYPNIKILNPSKSIFSVNTLTKLIGKYINYITCISKERILMKFIRTEKKALMIFCNSTMCFRSTRQARWDEFCCFCSWKLSDTYCISYWPYFFFQRTFFCLYTPGQKFQIYKLQYKCAKFIYIHQVKKQCLYNSIW